MLGNPKVPCTIIRQGAVKADGKLRGTNNNGRKHCATQVLPEFGEHLIDRPEWRPSAVLPTGEGGLEVATFTECAGQDRHKHEKATDIYTVLQGELEIYINDGGPYKLYAGDEIVVFPGTIHEVVQKRQEAMDAGEEFELLVRVHSIHCYGAADKFVQLLDGGPWRVWSDLTKEERSKAYRKQTGPTISGRSGG